MCWCKMRLDVKGEAEFAFNTGGRDLQDDFRDLLVMPLGEVSMLVVNNCSTYFRDCSAVLLGEPGP